MKFIDELIQNNLLIVFALIAILQAIKQVLPKEAFKYLDLMAIGFGIIATGFVNGFDVTAVLNGIILGLASGKLYDKLSDSIFTQYFDKNGGE